MLKRIFFSTLFLISFREVKAQAVGSISTYGGSSATKSISTGGTSADVSETLYIGPGTHSIEGTWEIYARQVLIDPNAVISGNGVIEYYNPSIAGGVPSITFLDGNATINSLDVNIQLQNNSGMQLSEMSFPVSHTVSGWVNNAGSSTLYVGRNLTLGVDGADIILGSTTAGDLRFDNDATILNFRPERMVITNNSILSHIVKENYTTAFIFPAGIADGDYTPAQISNISANTIHLSVQDYIASASDEAISDPGAGGFPADGMQRTWHIYGDGPGSGSLITLQHNSITNQSGFTDISHFVTQWSATIPNTTGDISIPYSTSAWQSNTGGAGASGNLISPSGVLGGASMRSRSYSTLATSASAEESYFTKSADAYHPLPLHFINNNVLSRQCAAQLNWVINKESPAKSFKIMHGINGRGYKTIATIHSVKNISDYTFTDSNAAEGNNFYFIEIVLHDGSSVRSSTMKAEIKCPTPATKTYPNPTQDFLTIEHLNDSINTLNIYSIDGKPIIRKEGLSAQNGTTILNIAHLAQGIYYMKILFESGKEDTIKIIKE